MTGRVKRTTTSNTIGKREDMTYPLQPPNFYHKTEYLKRPRFRHPLIIRTVYPSIPTRSVIVVEISRYHSLRLFGHRSGAMNDNAFHEKAGRSQVGSFVFFIGQ